MVRNLPFLRLFYFSVYSSSYKTSNGSTLNYAQDKNSNKFSDYKTNNLKFNLIKVTIIPLLKIVELLTIAHSYLYKFYSLKKVDFTNGKYSFKYNGIYSHFLIFNIPVL